MEQCHFVTTSPFRNGSHLPTTQCACADFVDFATQRNGGGGREKDLYQKVWNLMEVNRTATQVFHNAPLASAGDAKLLHIGKNLF
jgi:hypothetical protein